ncbi:hypothetical protein [Streptomyces sp. B93]|uniref:hypothetical protein n=1 Tax=Streptomyces sp. B93 TaxID=2824875 RepID=UPI001B363BD4|nr:hypothetical protein [Streptomyces sp. B93]MBQ1092475.1 hypothetical protein [Streptomyces sp. B93]
MPADEVTHGTEVDESRVRTGPRHAAPKKPLFTRFHMPAGKAIALAAMPTAVLMGLGFTPKLALAEDQPVPRSLTADEYKDCIEALEDAENGDSEESATPTPSATTGSPTPEPSATEDASGDDTSSPDSGSDDESGSQPAPTPSASSGGDAQSSGSGATEESDGSGEAATEPEPSASETEKGVLETIGDAVTGVVDGVVTGITGGGDEETASPTPTESAPADTGTAKETEAADDGGDPAGSVKDTAEKVTDAVEDTAEDTAEAVEEEAAEATESATPTPTPTPSASETTDLDDCPVATDAEGGIDNTVPLPDDPWYLDASSLLLKGAKYEGIVEVKTANGTVKKVLKYVISDGTDIGDLHQTVKDPQSGKTYHVQAARGSTSTIRDGDTVMYTESISGNLLGLIPITFDPEHPPPLDIPLIYFTKVKVVQAGQFGGTLHVPGLHQYVTG